MIQNHISTSKRANDITDVCLTMFTSHRNYYYDPHVDCLRDKGFSIKKNKNEKFDCAEWKIRQRHEWNDPSL